MAVSTQSDLELCTMQFVAPRNLTRPQICDLEIALEDHPEVVHVERVCGNRVTFVVTHGVPSYEDFDQTRWNRRWSSIRKEIGSTYLEALRSLKS